MGGGGGGGGGDIASAICSSLAFGAFRHHWLRSLLFCYLRFYVYLLVGAKTMQLGHQLAWYRLGFRLVVRTSSWRLVTISLRRIFVTRLLCHVVAHYCTACVAYAVFEVLEGAIACVVVLLLVVTAVVAVAVDLMIVLVVLPQMVVVLIVVFATFVHIIRSVWHRNPLSPSWNA